MTINNVNNPNGTQPLRIPYNIKFTENLDENEAAKRKAAIHEKQVARDASATGSLSAASAEYNNLQAAGATVDNTMRIIDGNLQAQQDLQTLKDQGKLTPDVMQGLERLATKGLADGINRQDLIATALRNLVDPTSISQGGRDTCAAATVQIMLAKDDPAEYLHLIEGLASEEGTATLKNGETIQRDPNWNNNADRSVLDNLMQPAFMAYASGGYDNVTDTRKDGAGKGLYASEEAKLAGAVQGKEMLAVFGNSPETMALLEKATGKGKSIPAVIKLTDPKSGKTLVHSVLVESCKDGNVTFIDKKGSRQTVPESEFKKMVETVDLPAEMLTPSQKKTMVAGEKKGPLAGCGGGIGGLVGGLVKLVVKAAPIISMVAAFVPGLNVAAWFLKGLNVAKAIADKNPLGAIGAFVGGAVGNTMQKVSNVVQGYKNGGIVGALGAAGGAVGGDTGKMISQAANVVNAAQHGSIAGVVAAAGGVVGGETGQTMLQAGRVINAVQTGNLAGAASSIGGLVGGTTGQTIAQAGNAINALQHDNLAGAANAIGGLVGGETGQTIAQAGNAINALQHDNLAGAANAIGGLVGGETGQTIAQAGNAINAVQTGNLAGAANAIGGLVGGTTGQLLNGVANVAAKPSLNTLKALANDVQTAIAANSATSGKAAISPSDAQGLSNGVVLAEMPPVDVGGGTLV